MYFCFGISFCEFLKLNLKISFLIFFLFSLNGAPWGPHGLPWDLMGSQQDSAVPRTPRVHTGTPWFPIGTPRLPNGTSGPQWTAPGSQSDPQGHNGTRGSRCDPAGFQWLPMGPHGFPTGAHETPFTFWGSHARPWDPEAPTQSCRDKNFKWLNMCATWPPSGTSCVSKWDSMGS